MPTLIENRPIKPRLLADVGAVGFRSTLCAGGHSFGVEVFQNNGSKPLAKIECGSVVPVLADTGRSRLNSGNTASGLGVSVRPTFPAAQYLLCPTLRPIQFGKTIRQSHKFTRGQSQRLSNAAINTNARHIINRGVVFNGKAKADMPTIRHKADCGVVNFADKLAGISEFNPTDFRQAHDRPFGIQLSDTDLAALKAKRIIQAAFSGAGVFGNTLEEITVSPIEVAQGLLLAGLANGGYPVVFGSQGSQFTALSSVVQALTCSGLKVTPVFTPLLEGQIINKAAYTCKLPEQFRLLGRGMQFETVAALDHGATLFNLLKGFNMSVKTGAHSVFDLHVHLVFVTKYRRKVLSIPAIQDLRSIFAEICARHEADLVECDGEDDHVHLLIHYPPKLALSKLINTLKGTSSRYLREDRPEISGCYRNGVLWSPSYFAGSCGGAPLSVIAEYVKQQRKEAPLPPRPKGRGIRGAFR